MNKNVKVEKLEKKWFIVDAKDKILGRLASRIASVLRGKDKASFAPNADKGDYVIIINAEKVKVTGKKYSLKTYFTHSTYPGGGKFRTFEEQLVKNPTKILKNAIKGMVPKNALGREVLRKLFIYTGTEHKHQAQKPVELKV